MPDQQTAPAAESAASTPPAKPARPETAQDNLALNTIQAGQPDVEDAHAYLAPLIPAAHTGLALREDWRRSPVTPQPADDVQFAPYETVDALVAHARAQRVPSYPAWESFTIALQRVVGHVDTHAQGEAILGQSAKLTARDCARQPAFRAWRRWPAGHPVEKLANALGVLANMDRGTLDNHARWLAIELTRLLVWSRNHPAPPLTPALEQAEGFAPSPTVTQFNIFARPR